VIEAPKPCIVWKVCVGSTTTVGTVLGAVENWTGARLVSLSVPSAVLAQTWAVVIRCAAAGLAAVAAAAVVPAAAAPSTVITPRVPNRALCLLTRMKKSP